MTVPQIILRAEISQYLAVNAIQKGGTFGKGIPSHLPSLIYSVRKVVSRVYTLDPANELLTKMANYLYAICGQFGIQASYLISSGGSIPAPSGTTQYSLPVTVTYTASVDGEYILPINLPSGAKVIFAQKGAALPLNSTQYNYISPNLTLLGGIVMSADEDLTYQYVLPI